jgi:hypothetical protein
MIKKIAIGAQRFDVSAKTVNAFGRLLAENGAKKALTGRIAQRIHDTDGKARIAAPVVDLSLTQFEETNLRRILQTAPVTTWRIGEAIAECYLEDHYGFLFPWNTGRDLRNEDASQAGPDLIGFKVVEGSARFAFGEAKTSEDQSTPPNLMYGRTGMIEQLESICDDFDRRSTLIRYLGVRHVNEGWRDLYRSAFVSYLSDDHCFSLAGVLVSTTQPNPKDLESRTQALSKTKPADALLLALYVPLPLSHWPLLVFPSEGGQDS